MIFRTLDDAGEIYEKRALVRVDLNVPMEGDRVTTTPGCGRRCRPSAACATCRPR
jgi:3-phosphoglycerate kinase